jgi:hypothetical protein
MRRFAIIILLTAIFSIGTEVMAQDEVTTYTTESGLTFAYPSTWTRSISQEWTNLTNLPPDQEDDPNYFTVAVILSDTSVWQLNDVESLPVQVLDRIARFDFVNEIVGVHPDYSQEQIETFVYDRLAKRNTTRYSTDNYPAARTLYTTYRDDETIGVFMIAVQVASNKAVLVRATSMSGVSALLSNRDLILAIANSVSYVPLAASGNPALPQTYVGPVGFTDAGTLKFNYPSDWYSGGRGSLQNTTGVVSLGNPLPEQIGVVIDGPETPMMILAGVSSLNDCTVNLDGVTAAAYLDSGFIQRQFSLQYEADLVLSEPEMVDINGHPGILFRAHGQKRDIFYVAVDMGGGNILPMMAFTAPSEMTQYEQTLIDITKTFEFTPNADRCAATPTPQ